MKRVFDFTIAICALVLLAPLLALIAVVIRIKLGAPVLFSQRRPGLGGQIFTLWKFRTMTDETDSSGRLLTDAERLTSLGRWLRSTSLDELPELWNVLLGDMSLVGPRPLLVRYLNRYTCKESRRHEVRPGLTGLAQIKGRNHTAWERRLRYDVWYVDHRTFWLDLKIILETALLVIRRDGIHAVGEATMPEFRPDNGICRHSYDRTR